MRILLIHSDYLNYTVKKETPVAEEIEEAKKEGSFDDSLVVLQLLKKTMKIIQKVLLKI